MAASSCLKGRNGSLSSGTKFRYFRQRPEFNKNKTCYINMKGCGQFHCTCMQWNRPLKWLCSRTLSGRAAAQQAVCRGFEPHLSSSFFIFYGERVAQVSCITFFIYPRRACTARVTVVVSCVCVCVCVCVYVCVCVCVCLSVCMSVRTRYSGSTRN